MFPILFIIDIMTVITPNYKTINITFLMSFERTNIIKNIVYLFLLTGSDLE